jgi:hypothetical protein
MNMASAQLIDWLANGERGISSNTMVQHLTGIKTLRGFRGSHPLDPDDMTRCRYLIEDVPEIAEAFPRMATCSPEWAALVEHWQEICDLMDREAPKWRDNQGSAPQTYKLMEQLFNGARKTAAKTGAS